ncbi:MAG TPA: DinB family protein [Chryseosolibacter sp.]|nr:DinB family protein [Chryseosolibacter sp.]
MKKLEWFERTFAFGVPTRMLPFYLERLEGTIARLEKRTLAIDDQMLSEKVDGKWSIKQNIGHLAEVDQVALRRIDEMRQGISPMSPAVFEPKGDYNAMHIDDVLTFFRNTRMENLQKYASLTELDLVKSSLHPRLKVQMNPVDLAFFDAEHDDHHLVRISEILLALR